MLVQALIWYKSCEKLWEARWRKNVSVCAIQSCIYSNCDLWFWSDGRFRRVDARWESDASDSSRTISADPLQVHFGRMHIELQATWWDNECNDKFSEDKGRVACEMDCKWESKSFIRENEKWWMNDSLYNDCLVLK